MGCLFNVPGPIRDGIQALRSCAAVRRIIGCAVAWAFVSSSWAAASLPAPAGEGTSPFASAAFFYGPDPPVAELRAFDLAVVEPDYWPADLGPDLGATRLAAYVSVGEIAPTRSYAAQIPDAWRRGRNAAWDSWLIDQAQPEWPAYFADHVIGPLWERGWRTFFLDTLDAYERFARTPEQVVAQRQGLLRVVHELVRRYPGIRFVFNRGFDILPEARPWVDAVVAESLYRRFDADHQQYERVPDADRDWLEARLATVRKLDLPVIVVDYVPGENRAEARDTARQIMARGYIPWVATPALDTLGVGSVEVMPRRVLVVTSPVADEYAFRRSAPVVYGSMPLQYLGYVPEFVDPAHLPTHALAGRYAGVLVWLTGSLAAADRETLLGWLSRVRGDGLPISLLGQVSFLLGTPLASELGLDAPAPAANPPPALSPEVVFQDGMIGFEAKLRPQPDGFTPIRAEGAQPLLTLRRGQDQQVAAAVMPWGGYVMDPYTIITLPGSGEDTRWLVNPFEFLRRTLKLPDMPVPDVSTESGRRVFFAHMDGDGFVSRSELPGHPLAGEVLRDRVVRRYRLPMTISVIEAELSPQGLYPELSASAEQAARDIYREPEVAIASHSYTHPFNWAKADAAVGTADADDYHLNVPGYRFDLEREVQGSVDYINSRLAPPGKTTAMFFWTGDCIPGDDAIAATRRAGLLNLNGGDTVATRSQPTLTAVEGLGVPHRTGYQVFAPNQNENVYTNNWRGPYYGFQRVIETFELTGSPRRLKPINLYFHTYLLTKRAGMEAFDRIVAYVQSQGVTPVFAADYARAVLDFQRFVVARGVSDGRWVTRSDGALHTLRVPAALGTPDLARSRGVAGFHPEGDVTYVHLVGTRQTLDVAPGRPSGSTLPRLDSSNAQVRAFEGRPGVQRWTLEGNVPLEFALADVDDCRIQVEGRTLTPVRRTAQLSFYTLSSHAARPLEAICRP